MDGIASKIIIDCLRYDRFDEEDRYGRVELNDILKFVRTEIYFIFLAKTSHIF